MSSAYPLLPSSSRDIRNLVWSTLALRVLTILIAFLSSYLPLFDASPSLVSTDPDSPLSSRFANLAMRWDAFHYLAIAHQGYRYEHQYAFMPGLPILLRILSHFGAWLSDSVLVSTAIIPHFILSTLFSLDTTRLLYLLSLHHTGSRHLALLSAYLSLLPSSPAILHLAPYTEPWFTWASYRGMLYCARHQWLKAACLFLFAGCFRSNAFMLGGFIFWGAIIDTWLGGKKIRPLNFISATMLSLFPLVPFLLHQYSGYQAFCINNSHPRPCGFLLYWTRHQLPNFLISAPVALLLLWGSLTVITNVGTTVVFEGASRTSSGRHKKPFHTKSILPHAIYALLFTLMLLLFAHTQIILRQASSVPFLYWSAARLFFEKPAWSRRWVVWSVLWGLTSYSDGTIVFPRLVEAYKPMSGPLPPIPTFIGSTQKGERGNECASITVNGPSRISADSDGTFIDPGESQKVSYHVRGLDCEENALRRPLLLCLPTSLTYVCDVYLFTIGLIVLPALSRVAFFSASSFLGFLSSLTWFAIGGGIALFPSMINPHDVGYFYVIQYAKFWFIWWRCISHSVLPYFPLPTSTPVQHHIINPYLKIFFVLSFTLCTQNMYSQLLKCHRIPPYERKSFRAFETIMAEVRYIYGITVECLGRFLCRTEQHIGEALKQCFNIVVSTKSSRIGPPTQAYKVDRRVGKGFRKHFILDLKSGGYVTLVARRLAKNVGLDAFFT